MATPDPVAPGKTLTANYLRGTYYVQGIVENVPSETGTPSEIEPTPGPVSEDTPINIGSRIYGWYNANPSGNLPNTVYTTSTTPVTGMTLYNSLGHDLGLTISVVNQDGSFDIATPAPVTTTYYAWGPYRGSYVYTTSATPVVGDKLYEYSGGSMIWSASSIAAGNVAYAGSASVTNENGYSYDRDSTEDITI